MNVQYTASVRLVFTILQEVNLDTSAAQRCSWVFLHVAIHSMHGAPWVMGAAGGEFAGMQSLAILQLLKSSWVRSRTNSKKYVETLEKRQTCTGSYFHPFVFNGHCLLSRQMVTTDVRTAGHTLDKPLLAQHLLRRSTTAELCQD